MRLKKAGHGAEKNPVILVRAETTPEDIHGMEVAIGILTSQGGIPATRQSSLVAWAKPALQEQATSWSTKEHARCGREGQVFKEGDWITLDGTAGRVLRGKRKLLSAGPG